MHRPSFSSSAASAIFRISTLIIFFLIFHQKMNAEAFLLTHRSLLVPFASAHLAKNKQQQPRVPSSIYGTVKRKEMITTQPPIAHQINLPSAVSTPLNAQRANNNVVMMHKPHSRRKRMHCLTTLRKIGDPRSVSSVKDVVQRYRHVIRHQVQISDDYRSMLNADTQ